MNADQQHILQIANEELYKGDISLVTALAFVNQHPLMKSNGIEIVHIGDEIDENKSLIPLNDDLHFDICSDCYYKSDVSFVNVFLKDGSYFRANKNTMRACIAFYCEETKKYYSSNDFTRVYCDGIRVCFEVLKDSIFRWNDGKYRFHRQPNDAKPIEINYLPDYHSVNRPDWWKEAKGIGMELEINCDDRIELVNILPKDILAEHDGSLCEEIGIELIGGPYTCKDYQEGKTPWNEALKLANDIGAEGHGAGTNYGIHLSVSRSLFSTLHAAKFVVFFNQQKILIQEIAQRDNFYSGKYGIRNKVSSPVIKKTDVTTFDNKTKRFLKKKYYLNTDKYEAVNADEKRLEVRVFRSNLKWERILKNIEFVQAVFDFTLNASIEVVSDNVRGTEEFIKWLDNQSDFKELKNFLHERKNKKSSNKIFEKFKYIPKKLKKITNE